jgi:hypothetical protein
VANAATTTGFSCLRSLAMRCVSAGLKSGSKRRFENADGSDSRRPEGIDFYLSVNEPANA